MTHGNIYLTKMAITHSNCFTELTKNFPEIFLFVFPHLSSEGTYGILKVFGKEENSMDEYIMYLSDFIREIKKLAEDDSGTTFFYKSISEHESVLKGVIQCGCIPNFPVVVSEGKETWNIFSAEKTRIMALFKWLESANIDVKLLSHKPVDPLSFIAQHQISTLPVTVNIQLTDKQKEAIKTALDMGYYEWPRNIKVEDMASVLGISRSSFLHRLRKAEKVIMDGIGRWLE